MKTLFITLVLLCSLPLFSQMSPNANQPDFMEGGHLAPFTGSAGQQGACAFSDYEVTPPAGASDSLIWMRLGPCAWAVNQNGRFTSASPINIQQVSCWIGTSSNSRFETVSNLQIWQFNFVTGQFVMIYDWLCEFDKHTDYKGNIDEKWNYSQPLQIPANAIFTTYRYPGGLIFCGADYWRLEGPSVASGTQANPSGANAATNWGVCATEIQWRIYGTGK